MKFPDDRNVILSDRSAESLTADVWDGEGNYGCVSDDQAGGLSTFIIYGASVRIITSLLLYFGKIHISLHRFIV